MSHVIKAAASILQMSANELESALERARVVGVLDAWAAKDPTVRTWVNFPEEEETEPFVSLRHNRERSHVYGGKSLDAARAAAAKAIEAGEV